MLTPISGQNDRSPKLTAPAEPSGTQVAQPALPGAQAVTGFTGPATSSAVDATLIAFASGKPQPPGALEDGAIAAIPSDAVAQLLKNLQSLGAPNPAGTATPSRPDDSGTAPAPTEGSDEPNRQPHLQSSAAPVRTLPHGGLPNDGTSATDGTPTEATDPLGSFMQLVAMAAYASGYASGMESPHTSSTIGFSA